MTDSINDYIYQEEDSGTPFEEFENETSGGDDENYSKELTGATDTGGDYGGREKPGKSGDQSGRKKWSRYEEEKVLQVYFRDLLTEPLLTSTEEKELSAKIKECERKAREIKKKIDSMAGNRERADVKISKAESVDDSIKILDAQCKLYSEKAGMFREQFIKANLRLVVSIAKRHLGRGLPLTDLVQEGALNFRPMPDGGSTRPLPAPLPKKPTASRFPYTCWSSRAKYSAPSTTFRTSSDESLSIRR